MLPQELPPSSICVQVADAGAHLRTVRRWVVKPRSPSTTRGNPGGSRGNAGVSWRGRGLSASPRGGRGIPGRYRPGRRPGSRDSRDISGRPARPPSPGRARAPAREPEEAPSLAPGSESGHGGDVRPGPLPGAPESNSGRSSPWSRVPLLPWLGRMPQGSTSDLPERPSRGLDDHDQEEDAEGLEKEPDPFEDVLHGRYLSMFGRDAPGPRRRRSCSNIDRKSVV